MVQLSLEHLFDGLPPNVALRRRSGKRFGWNDDDEFGRIDTFVKITSSVERTGLPDDFPLQFVVIGFGTWLDEQRRRSSTRSDDDTLQNEISACSPNVVLDRPGIASEAILALDPVVISSARDISAWRHLLEKISSVEMPVCLSERDVGTVTGS